MIHNVNARNGNRHMKKLSTTAPSMKITCLRYLSTLLRFPCDVIPGLFIRCFAITVYRTTSMTNGSTKNIEILPTKKNDGQNVSTAVKQTCTLVPSTYSSEPYWAIDRIGLRCKGTQTENISVVHEGCFISKIVYLIHLPVPIENIQTE